MGPRDSDGREKMIQSRRTMIIARLARERQSADDWDA